MKKCYENSVIARLGRKAFMDPLIFRGRRISEMKKNNY